MQRFGDSKLEVLLFLQECFCNVFQLDNLYCKKIFTILKLMCVCFAKIQSYNICYEKNYQYIQYIEHVYAVQTSLIFPHF